MAQQINTIGSTLGDPNGCVVCHGGNPKETKSVKLAHMGAPKGGALDVFTPVPGSFDLNSKTCGTCHPVETSSTRKSMMNSEAGKIKVITYGWGVDNNTFKVKYADANMKDEDGYEPIYGTKEYKAYMQELVRQHLDQFPQALKEIPKTDVKNIGKDPKTAVYNYMRNCNACHTSGKGKQLRGHFRGVGCAACHVPYSEAGLYEGGDKTMKGKKGVMMVHSIQATRKSKVHVNGGHFSGVQVSTCNACHSSGRRISSQFQGIYPTDKGGQYMPFNKDGKLQQPNASYLYKHVGGDVHFKGGMVCQDCHTSPDLHGNGNIGTVALGDVEIECQDCHGTPTKYPWELKLGYSDGIMNMKAIKDNKVRKLLDKPRGLSKVPMAITQEFATVYPAKDGYLISARGNPLGNVVKDGNKVILHSATGKDFVVPVLKTIEKTNSWKSPEGRLAMVGAAKHLQKMECYTCHSTWAASYYGYTYNMDFTKGKQFIDWIASSQKKFPNGTAADYKKDTYLMIPGSAPGDYSYARWENPILGINGEGRVSPLVGVIQTVGTVTDENGKVVMLNNVARDKTGMLSIDMQPMQPHTNVLKARECKSCHQNRVVMGFGERYNFDNSKPVYLGVRGSDGKMLSRYAKPQISAIPGLNNGRDFMKILDAKGKQIMKVDAHFKNARALYKVQINELSDPAYRQKAKDQLRKIDKARK